MYCSITFGARQLLACVVFNSFSRLRNVCVRAYGLSCAVLRCKQKRGACDRTYFHFQEKFHCLPVPILTRDVQGGGALVGELVEVCVALQQQFGDASVSVPARGVDGLAVPHAIHIGRLGASGEDDLRKRGKRLGPRRSAPRGSHM